MPKLYTIRDMIKAWDEAYGEDLREEEGFLQILKARHGQDMRGRLRSMQRGNVSSRRTTTPKRKLSAWNKFVKANSKKPRFIYKSGSNKGKLNLKKMGVAFRKTPAGKRKK